jgi:cell division protein FtsB
MTNSSEVQDAVRARKQEVAELAEAANEAAKLEQEITNLRRELVPLVERRPA